MSGNVITLIKKVKVKLSSFFIVVPVTARAEVVLLASFGEELLKVWVVCPQDVRVDLLVYLVTELVLDQSLELVLSRGAVHDQLGPPRQHSTLQHGP